MSQPGQNPSQQPISFKTVPGRSKTQKWQQAKANNYDGDDWGGYDDYDDYGGYDEPQQQQPQQQGQQYGNLQRQSSFDRGVDSERRQFSSGTAIHDSERYTSPTGSGGRVSQDTKSPDEARRRMREFSNPGQVPQPLNTPRSPVAPGSVERPPRKSSLGGGSPAPEVRPIPLATSPTADKPLPFIRPSDIYKRMAEEQHRERQSMESGRPSMDAIQREVGSPTLAQHTLTHKRSQESLPSSTGRRPSLGPVSEPVPTASENTLPAVREAFAPHTNINQPTVQPGLDSAHPEDTSPRLPPVSRVSDFGSFMPRDEEQERLSATGLAASTAAANAAASALSSSSRDVTPTMASVQSQYGHGNPNHTSDPAADIAAERSTDAPVQDVGRVAGEDPSGLSHQPSSGFRSVVHKAFDSQGDNSMPTSPILRDDTQPFVQRSDTNSTRSISPIMSRVPSAATAQQKQQERDVVVPSIAEETPLEVARSRPMSDGVSQTTLSSRPSIMRKPTPNHSRNVSSEVAGFTPGYRRSMDTPSPNNSPARTPALGDTSNRRLSGPMAAQTVTGSEAPDVDPRAPEMPSATLEAVETPLETPGSMLSRDSDLEPVKSLPTTGRGRSGTNYSMRESDLAREANNSPDAIPAVAEAATIQQNLFLDTHPSNPGSPTGRSPVSGIAKPFPHPAGSGSGRDSPAGTGSRSRVRNIVDQFHQIDSDSRRNSVASSKSSWSNFAGDEDNAPGLNRRATGGSTLGQPTPGLSTEDATTAPSVTSPSRPDMDRPESFRPHLPGEWISAAPTPANEVPDAPASDDNRGRDQTSRNITPASPPTPRGQQFDEEVDLTPTTRKTKLRESNPTIEAEEPQNLLAAVKNAGDALGTALLSHTGYGHDTKDFASKSQPAPVDIPEMQPHRQTGNIDHLSIPTLRREDSDAPSDGTSSVANSIPPTPPDKDTPQPPGLGANIGPTGDRPVSNYFAGYGPDAIAPLSFGKQSPSNSGDLEVTRPTVLPTMSTDTRATDFESDRLRKDIVRSLGPEQFAQIKRESIMEDVERTEDALEVPNNERRVAGGESALPSAATKNANARSGLPSQSRPGLLGQRFSWEGRSADSGDALTSHIAVVGETEGDEDRECYERPRSNQGLHVINTQVTADSEPSTAEAEKQVASHFMLNEPAEAEKRLSSSIPIGTAALALGSQAHPATDGAISPIAESPEKTQGGLDEVAPTPMVEDIDEAARTAESQSPHVSSKDHSPSTPAAAPQSASTAAQSKIPAFRDLAAIKSTDDRIAAYESTRRRFADMNTGLSGWLSGMLSAHPEYANAGNQKYEGPAAIQTTGLSNTISGIGGTIRGHGHKHSPSILKIGTGGGGTGERKASSASTGPATASGSGGGHADVEKMQAKGKDFMKSAGAGAKGLFAKGKSRFGRGGEKASTSTSTPSSSSTQVQVSSSIPAAAAAPVAAPTTSAKHEHTLSSASLPASALVDDEVMAADRAPAAAVAERPKSIFGKLRSVSRSRSRPGSGVWGESKSPGPSRSASRAASRAASVVLKEEPEPMPVQPMPAQGVHAQPVLTDFAPTTTDPLAMPTANRSAEEDPSTPAKPLPRQKPSLGVLPPMDDRRKEMWEDDGAEVGDAGWRTGDGRLGVLPSPSVQESIGPASPNHQARKGSWIGETIGEPLDEVRGEEGEERGDDAGGEVGGLGAVGGAAVGGGVAGVGAGAMVEDAQSRDQQGESPAPAPAAAPERSVSPLPATEPGPEARRSSLEPDKVRMPSPTPGHVQTRSASYAIPSVATRPLPERKFSALEQLPSQQRRRQFTPVATPRRLSLADGAAAGAGTFAAMAAAGPASGDAEREVKSATSTKSGRPVTPALWDKLDFASTPKVASDAVSRRSSVSSMGDPASQDTAVVPGGAEKLQSAAGMPVESALDEDQGRRSVSPLPVQSSVEVPGASSDFMDRSYHAEHPDQRPMSYMPLGRDSSGLPMQEAIGVKQASGYSTPSGVAGYATPGTMREPTSLPMQEAIGAAPPSGYSTPSGVAAYPASATYTPPQSRSRAPSLGQPANEYDRLRQPLPGDVVPVSSDTSASQPSFRGPDVPAGALPAVAPTQMPSIPSPSKVDENYNGLIDPQIAELANDIAKEEQPQKRRKSGIMGTFRRTSVHSSSRPSSHGSLGKIAAENASESTLAKTKTLKKPQRAASTAAEPPKNKRFSGLGSLFRRSTTRVPRVNTQPTPSTTATSAPASAMPANSQAASAHPPASTYPPANTETAPPKPPKKLTKTQTPQQIQQQQQEYQQRMRQQQRQQQYSQRPYGYYTPAPPGNYAAYEAMMRQQALANNGQPVPPQYWQQTAYSDPAMVSSPYQQVQQQPQQPAAYYQQGPPPTQAQQGAAPAYQQYPSAGPDSRTQSLVGSPAAMQSPPMEYYGSPKGQSPAAYGAPPSQPSSPPPTQAMPQMRRLHSEGPRPLETVPGIPEAHSPVESASPQTNEPPARSNTDGQVGLATTQAPHQQTERAAVRPTMDTRQSSMYSQASMARSPTTAPAPDNFPQAPGRQDYQTQYWQHQHQQQRSPQSLPPVQTNIHPMHQQTTSVGSIDQQMARSPAMQYQDQQTPWSVGIPRGQASNRTSATSSWATQSQSPTQYPQQQYSGPPAAARGAVRSTSSPRHQDQYSSMTPYHFVSPQQLQNVPPQQRTSYYGEQVASPTAYTPTSPQAYGAPQPHYDAYAPSRQQRSQPGQNRYYGQQRQYSQDTTEARPLSYQRTASGYSGRRDDAGVSEAEIMSMRGASYPGQEWTPGRM